MSRFGTAQPDGSACGHAGIRHKRDVGGMMDHMPVMNSSMMHGHGPMMHGHGPMMHGPMRHGPMMHDEVIQDGSESVREKSAGVDDGQALPRVDVLMLPDQVMPDVGNMIPEARDSVGVQLADVLSNPDNKISAKHDAAAAAANDDDHRDLIIPFGSQADDISPFHHNFPKYGRVGLNAGEDCLIAKCVDFSLLKFVPSSHHSSMCCIYW